MNIEEVFTLKRERINTCAEMHRQMKKALDMYNGDWHVLSYKIRSAKKLHEVLPVTARLIVESVAADVRPTSFDIEFKPLKNTIQAKEQADGLEDLCHMLLERWGTCKALSPFSEAGKNVAIYGLSGLRTLYDSKAWGNRPEQRDGETGEDFDYREALWEAQRSITVPLVVNAIDPLNMLPPPGVIRNLPDMIEFYKVKPDMLVYDFPDYRPPECRGEIDFTTYMNKDTWMYLVGNEVVGNKSLRDPQNPYGIVPYTLVWSGLGKNSPYGKPEQRAVGLIYPLIGLLEEEARALTSVSIILQVAAIGRGWTRNAPKEGLNIGMGPGDVTELGSTEFGWWENPPISKDLYAIYQIAGQQIERMVGEKLLGGTRPVGVTSALFEEMLREYAHRRYKTLIDSMEAAYSDVLAQGLFLIENFVEDPIPGVKIKPEQIRGYYLPQVTFQYEDIAEKRIRAMIARMLFLAGLIDFEKAHDKEYLNSPDVMEIRKGLIKDQLYKNPELIAAMALDMAKQMGVDQLLQQAAERKQQGSKIEIPPSTKLEQQAASELVMPEQETIEMPGFAGGGLGMAEGEAMGVQ